MTLEALSLASGEVVDRDEQCFGGDVADELGFQTVDLEEDLAQCESAPYVSETMEKENGLLAWNPDDCMPWQYIEPAPVGDTDTEGKDASGLDAMGDEGCARSADGTAPGGASTLLSLGVLTSADDDSNDVRASNYRVSRLAASGSRPRQRRGRALGSSSSQRPSFVANRLRCHMARLSKMLAPSSNSSPRRRSTNAMTTWR